MWKSGGAHMILLVRIPKYKPTVTATGLMDMGMGMAPGTEKSICTHTCIPAGYICTHVQHYSFDSSFYLDVQIEFLPPYSPDLNPISLLKGQSFHLST